MAKGSQDDATRGRAVRVRHLNIVSKSIPVFPIKLEYVYMFQRLTFHIGARRVFEHIYSMVKGVKHVIIGRERIEG